MLLAIAQSLGGSIGTIIFSTTAILSVSLLDEDKALATLPITAYVLGTALGAMPAGLIMGRFGRRFGFCGAMLCGACFGLLASYAAFMGSFPLLCLSTFGSGVMVAFVQQFRFAAADTASDAFRPKAISWVLTGGIFAAIIGPQTVIFTKDWFEPFLFAGTYLAQAVICLLTFCVVSFLDMPKRQVKQSKERRRPLGQILRQPKFVVAVGCAMISYALMNLVMTSAPLAMVGCGLSHSDAALGIQWHVLAMFAPSFFTGNLLIKYGRERVIAAGFVILGLCGALALVGTELWIFWAVLILLGLGWNFSFVGATTLLTDVYQPEERTIVQAINDSLVFGTVAIASFSSGSLLHFFGWDAVAVVIFPFVGLSFILLLWLILTTKYESNL
ncbi:MFS transporter [Pseudovibrio flavus]|uniref:MFS transporter n=1 Tax=Pseudovibrio flavus TaxID=2529854 RepID=UPI0027B8BBDC|nr:MFS transporter [Pseudovibrio flavus]